MQNRDILVQALLPVPGPPQRPQFWRAFDAAAPFYLRLGFAFATWILVVLWPRLNGFLRPLGALSDANRDALLTRAAATPLMRDLVLISKIVVCFAAFHNEEVA